jgi:hypothetical protein
MTTKYSASSIKVEYPDGITVKRTQKIGMIIVERGSLTDRRIVMNIDASTSTPILHSLTE